MAIDHRIGNKIQRNLRREDAGGTRVDPFPYIGVVKNNLDPTRSGRIQVFIPDLGGPPDDPNNWRTVGYASPYMGYTSQVQNSTDHSSTSNNFDTVTHSYGMWMVPPDIGVNVIVLFIAGDPLRGYWLACVNPNLSHFMLPTVAGSVDVDPNSLSARAKQTYKEGDVVPVAEFNEYTKDFTNSAFYLNNKPIHETQYAVLKLQGLEKDPVRGAISSSSQRESPSAVFGISTPGRPLIDPADDSKNYIEQLSAGKVDPKYLTIKSRKGGHSFVMDDGAVLGEDQLIRLRTAGGHQILMNDTNNILYIANSDGTSWVEMSSDGSLNIYASSGVNIRSQNDINLHSDTNINMNAVNINMNASTKFQLNTSTTNILSPGAFNLQTGPTQFKSSGEFLVDAAGLVSLKSGGIVAVDGTGWYAQSSKTKTAKPVDPIQHNSLPDTTQNSVQQWVSNPGVLDTIVTVAPTHEPFQRATTGVFFTPASPGIEPGTYSAPVDATKSAQSTGVANPPTIQDLRNQPPCDCSIGNLTSAQLTAYYATIGKSESGGKYTVVNSIGYVGKYQFGYPALIDGGYVKSSCKSNAQLNNPNNWLGKNGVDSLQAFLGNPTEQEAAMCALTKRNYTTMCKIGAITSEQPPEDIAGMLAVAHLLGPGGAKNYRNGQSGADAYGTTGATYFNKGKYAVAVLAPQSTAVNAG
jgi:hypothetical protein